MMQTVLPCCDQRYQETLLLRELAKMLNPDHRRILTYLKVEGRELIVGQGRETIGSTEFRSRRSELTKRFGFEIGEHFEWRWHTFIKETSGRKAKCKAWKLTDAGRERAAALLEAYQAGKE